MDNQQAHSIIKSTLEQSFDKNKFIYLAKNLLNNVDESKAFHARGYVAEIFKDYVKTYERIGTYTDPDKKKIDVLIVYLQKETSIERARTSQRNFVAHYLKGRDQKDAGLIAFVSPNEEDWRFSFVKMEYRFEETPKGSVKVKEDFTPAKRYSFLVGKNENSHTAQSRLVPLLKTDERNPRLEEIEDLFSVEKATKEFFDKYRDLYLRTHETLELIVSKDKTLKQDFAEKNVSTVDFCKKLLGQIVFLYFLQRKGWFGVPIKKTWGEGDKKFLRSLFNQALEDKRNYFNDYLEPLFYEALAKERSDDYYSRFECRIPFLNGGLFDPINNYDWVNTTIDFPNELFSNNNTTKEGDKGDGILDIFDRFNFTVKEDEPLEKEVAVDPEMLGKVFENLLEVKDRKSKGTYYTPREIVHYMCVQSLVNYLATELEGKVSKEDIEKLIRHGESVGENEARVERKGEETDTYYYKLPESIREYANLIDDKLADIKVCDPAIGSGAFPVGMMTEIVRARATLSSYLSGRDRTHYNFKRHCIHNSLYGVDIDPGAIEIAKLRLWLSLIVDEEDIKQIKPLPNLDYKIMQGNSLLEEYEGIKLFDDKFIAKDTFDKDSQLNELKSKQSKLSNEFIKLHNEGKLPKAKQNELNAELERIASQIKKLSKTDFKQETVSLFDIVSEAKQKADKLKMLHEVFFDTIHKKEKDAIKKEIASLEWELIEATLKEQNKTSELKKLEEFKRTNTKPFFLWKLNFSEVFQSKKGFDVIIANPPWGSDLTKEGKLVLKNTYPLIDSSTPNSFAYFLGLANIISKGTVSFILPDSILIKDYAKTRRLIKPGLFVLKWFQNIGVPENIKPFINVEHDVCLVVFDKRIAKKILCSTTFYKPKAGGLETNEWLSEKDEMIFDEFDDVFNLMLSKKDLSILDKIRQYEPIGNYLQCHEGIHTGNARDILFKKVKDRASCKPLFYGGGAGDFINNYVSVRCGWYVDYREDAIDKRKGLYASLRDENIFKYPKIYISRTGNPFKAFLDLDSYASNNFFSLQYLDYGKNDIDSLKIILPFIVSRLAQYFIRTFAAPRLGNTFTETKIFHLLKFRIPALSDKQKISLKKYVDDIIALKQSNTDTSTAESNINKLIYQFYGLTIDEIAIVESHCK